MLADWSRQGDPRAKLLELELGSYLAEPGGNGLALGGEAERLIEDHRKELAGPVAEFGQPFSFELGLVTRLSIKATDLQADASRYFDAAPLLAFRPSMNSA